MMLKIMVTRVLPKYYQTAVKTNAKLPDAKNKNAIIDQTPNATAEERRSK